MAWQGEGKPGQQMTFAQAQAAGEARETWCAVECRKEADWCRSNRRHFKEHLSSSVFTSQNPGDIARCTWQVNRPTHLQRRHYQTHREFRRCFAAGLWVAVLCSILLCAPRFHAYHQRLYVCTTNLCNELIGNIATVIKCVNVDQLY